MKTKKIISLLLVLLFALGTFLSVPSFAEEIKSGTVVKSARIFTDAGTNSYHTKNGGDSSPLKDGSGNDIYLSVGEKVTVYESKYDKDGDLWYRCTTASKLSGYVYSPNIKIDFTSAYDADFENNLKNFPESYRDSLRELHSLYPNWQFKADNLSISFDDAVNAEYSIDNYKKTRKYIELTYGGEEWRDKRGYDAATDTWAAPEPRWTYANRQTIAYFMDPRNALNKDKIYAFLELSYNESQTVESLKNVVKGTFLENGYDYNQNAYIDDIIHAAEQSGVSAYVIASNIIIEQGTSGTSSLISGTYPGFENYYNFFNFGASGTTIEQITNSGLAHAQENGWNSRTTSIIEGSKAFSNGYIGCGQDTYYYMDFNVINKGWNHQYATAVYDEYTKAARLKKAYENNSSSELVFKIPVYQNMPSAASQTPSVILYPDVSKLDWFYEAVSYAKDHNIFTGYGNGYFGPADNIQRQDFIVALARYSGAELDKYSEKQPTFSDVKKGDYYYSAIAWAYDNKVTTGYDNGTFGVGDNITREQIITFLYRYSKDYLNLSYNITKTENDYKAIYTDFGNISSFAKEAVIWALAFEVIHGRDETTIAPEGNCSRAETAQIFYNIDDKNIFKK